MRKIARLVGPHAIDRRQRTERRRREDEHQPGTPERAVQAGCEHDVDSAGRRVEAFGILRLVLVGVLDLDAVTLERAVRQLAVDDDRLALLEDPSRLTVVAHRQRRSAERDRERRDPGVRHDAAAVDRALHTQAPAGLTAGPLPDLVDVAVVVDGRSQELGDEDTAGDEYQRQDDERRPPPRAGPNRWRACRPW